MKFVWWQASLISILISVLLFYPSFVMLEKINPVDHRPFDFGGVNLEFALLLAISVGFLVNLLIVKNKKILSIILFLTVVTLLFLVFLGV